MKRDGTLRRFFDWAVCGYGRGTKASLHTRGWNMGTDTRRGRLVAWLLDFDRAVRRSPESFRWWLADQLAQWALRLRGQRVTVFGYYDAARGNRAAELADRLSTSVALALGDAPSEDVKSALEDLQELESCMGGTWHRNATPPNSLARAAADLAATQQLVQTLARTHLAGDDLREAAIKIREAGRTVAQLARLDQAIAARKGDRA